MREIKFRIWDKVKKEWLFDYPEMGGFSLLGEIVLVEGIRDIPLSNLQNLEVNQFTGLKDENGKEIYEGDIVKATEFVEKPKNRIIRYDEPKGAYFMISNSETETQWNDCLTKDHIETFGYEVIGNIYENPELLSPSTNSINNLDKGK